jgi:hypothetical protein
LLTRTKGHGASHKKGKGTRAECAVKMREPGPTAGLHGMKKHEKGQDRPENKSTLPETTPTPRWCPPRLRKTQRQRVQKLRVKEIEEGKKEAKRDEWFNKEHPMAMLEKT